MTSNTPGRLKRGFSSAIAVALLAAGGILGISAPAHAAEDALVSADDLGSTYADPGQVVWLIAGSNGGTATIDPNALGDRSTIKLERPNANSLVSVFRSYGQGVRPADIPALLAGSSYSYTGTNVNFQLGVFYTPADPDAYGPAGTDPCTQAKDDGVDLPGMCFTTLKFETGILADGEYLTFSPGATPAPFTAAGNPGWWPTNRVGQYAANNRAATLDQLLGQMESYEVYAIGVNVGNSGGGGDLGDGWVLNLRFGGHSYSFGAPPVPNAVPTPPPAADTAGLEQFIADEGIDVDAQTQRFGATGDENTDLTALDREKPLNGLYTWSDPTDAFVDVYVYSTATFVGTFPVVNGNVILSGIDLSLLAPGAHHLLLQGQTSGTIGMMRFNVLRLLGSSGGEVSPIAIGAGALLLVGGSALLLHSRRRAA